MLKIVADENIPFVSEAFSMLGDVVTRSGRDLSAEDIKETDILLVRSVTEVNKVLLENSRVSFIASATAGLNHVDLDYLRNQKIHFANAPGSNAISAAEYVIAGICHWSLLNNKPLDNLRLGIIGRGHVGSRVLEFATMLGINCIANDPPLQDAGITGLSYLEEVLSCDIVTLHVPLTVKGNHPTLQLLDEQEISALKPGTLLINAARGGVIHEQPLLNRMRNDNDLSLILDVWEDEPDINLELLDKTLIGTPHIAGYSLDGKIRGTEMIYQACCHFLQKEPTWHVEELDLPDNSPKVSQSDNNQGKDIREQILSAYNITADDSRLKQPSLKQPTTAGVTFDHLRKTYPVRREFGRKLKLHKR